MEFITTSTDGLLATTGLGQVEDTWSFSGFAEVEGYTAEASGLPIFEVTYERDTLGRIAVRNEVVDGQAKEYAYAYDPAGRLWRVEEDGVLVAEYSYYSNGNRLEHWASGTTTLMKTLEVYRLENGQWVVASTHAGPDLCRAEPFAAVEFDMTRWWID